jgi:hypothetical protein
VVVALDRRRGITGWAPRATVPSRGQAGGSLHPPGRCAVPHLAPVVRDPAAQARWRVVELPARGMIRIVLAVAHLCQNSMCADLVCVRGLCQRCHLRSNHVQQWQTRRRTRRAAIEAAEQQGLWPANGPVRLDPRCPGVRARPHTNVLPWREDMQQGSARFFLNNGVAWCSPHTNPRLRNSPLLFRQFSGRFQTIFRIVSARLCYSHGMVVSHGTSMVYSPGPPQRLLRESHGHEACASWRETHERGGTSA